MLHPALLVPPKLKAEVLQFRRAFPGESGILGAKPAVWMVEAHLSFFTTEATEATEGHRGGPDSLGAPGSVHIEASSVFEPVHVRVDPQPDWLRATANPDAAPLCPSVTSVVKKADRRKAARRGFPNAGRTRPSKFAG